MIKRIPFTSLPFAGLLVLTLSACQLQDQREISKADWIVANPAPIALQNQTIDEQNSRHRVIMAVIDSGVDYNHPELIPHMNFQTDDHGHPRLGYDFLGKDSYPYPSAIRTNKYRGANAKEERTKVAAMTELLALKPELTPWIHPARSLPEEVGSGSYHGTHVAGLMVYDRPDFGVIPYRVLPDMSLKKGEDAQKFSNDNLIHSIQLAVKDGATIVNLSLGMAFQRVLKEVGELPASDQEKAYENLRNFARRMTDNFRRYPDVLFVVAAGNSGEWIDSRNRFGLPCGLKSPNVLCVSALDERGDIAPFTTIPLADVPLVFARGVNLLSTLPMNVCGDRALITFLQNYEETEEQKVKSRLLADFSKSELKPILEKCSKQNGFGYLSGTSMAAPLVSRLAAKITSRKGPLTGEQLIAEIKALTVESQVGVLPIYKIPSKALDRPSWYDRKPK